MTPLCRFVASALPAKILLILQLDSTCPVPLPKIFPFSFDPNQLYILRRPRPHKGAFRDRHERRAGDAVDADALLTNGADADGEVVWS